MIPFAIALIATGAVLAAIAYWRKLIAHTHVWYLWHNSTKFGRIQRCRTCPAQRTWKDGRWQ